MTSAKEWAGRRAAEYIQDGMTLGLGTGSTVYFTLVRLAERIKAEGLTVRGVPTSIDTETKARAMGIPMVDLADAGPIDLTIDGADEADGDFNLIKGGGGALLREKVVAAQSRREVIVVGRDKLVERLGTTFKLPVEVVPFALAPVGRSLSEAGCEPHLRTGKDRADYRTDNGNAILDCHFPKGIADARALERAWLHIPGVVEVGLFIDLAHVLVIGEEGGSGEVLEK